LEKESSYNKSKSKESNSIRLCEIKIDEYNQKTKIFEEHSYPIYRVKDKETPAHNTARAKSIDFFSKRASTVTEPDKSLKNHTDHKKP
jgi:hypothetical protein